MRRACPDNEKGDDDGNDDDYINEGDGGDVSDRKYNTEANIIMTVIVMMVTVKVTTNKIIIT